MIDRQRMLKRLTPDGFVLSWESWLGPQFNFDYVRPSFIEGVFEHIDVDSMGRFGESVYCKLWVSPVRGHRLYFKPSPEVEEHLWDPADPGISYAVIKDAERADAWELKTVEVAPNRVRELALKHAENMAIETAAARKSAIEYARRIREISTESVMEYLEYQLSCRITPVQKQHADRLKAGGVFNEVAYATQCAAMAVALYGHEVDPEHNGFSEEPAIKSNELKLRLNITADLLRFPCRD